MTFMIRVLPGLFLGALVALGCGDGTGHGRIADGGACAVAGSIDIPEWSGDSSAGDGGDGGSSGSVSADAGRAGSSEPKAVGGSEDGGSLSGYGGSGRGGRSIEENGGSAVFVGGRNSVGGTVSTAGSGASDDGGSSSEQGGSVSRAGASSQEGGSESSSGSSGVAGELSEGGSESAGGSASQAGGTSGVAGSSTSVGGSQAGSFSQAGGSESFGGTSGIAGKASVGGSQSVGGISGVAGSSTTVGGSSENVGGGSSAVGGSSSGEGGISGVGGQLSEGGTLSIGGMTSAGGSGIPIIDFPALPATFTTNLDHFLVAGSVTVEQTATINGDTLLESMYGPGGSFASIVLLSQGENVVGVEISTTMNLISRSEKTITYDPAYSTADHKLVYVDVILLTDVAPEISGTAVIDPVNNIVLGIIPDKHIVGISPNGEEIYFSDRSVYSTATHQQTDVLAFSADIPSNGFLVSPDGTMLYSRAERLDVATNALLANLPTDITTGSSWASAPIPGGPVITSDGARIFCGGYVRMIDTVANTVVDTGISVSFASDLALSADDSLLFASQYAYTSGSVGIYDTQTYASVASVSGIGDFAGEIAVLPNGDFAVGSSGNPQSSTDGRVMLVHQSSPTSTGFTKLDSKSIPLADNLAASEAGELFVSAGNTSLPLRVGVDVYDASAGSLNLVKTIFLGVNGDVVSTGEPKNNQIKKIVVKERSVIEE